MYTEKIERSCRLAPPRVPDLRFAIVGNPRTGSSHLASLLDSHRDIACWDDEPFLAGGAFDKSGCPSAETFLHNVVFAVNARAVGFKLLWDAMVRIPNRWQLFCELRIALIHVYRLNPLDAYMSLELARLNGAFTSSYGGYNTQRLTIDYDRCRAWMVAAERHDNEIQEKATHHSIPRVEVEYHELCRDQTRILDFLDVPRCPLVSRLRKQRTKPQSAIITNYWDLKRRFAGSRWERCFNCGSR